MEFEKDEDIKETIKFMQINYADEKLPIFKESKSKGIYFYGEKNDFPEKLIDLYNRSPKHNAILTKRARFRNGTTKVILNNPTRTLKFNKYDSLKDFNYKRVLDENIFGAFALEVCYDRNKKPTFYHIPVSKIRTLDHESYQYWKDGAATKANDIIYYDAFDLNNVEMGEDGFYKKQIYYHRTYRADLGVYAMPYYIGALAYIQIDTRIANFHLNNISNGFTGGTLIQLFKGEPTPEEARKTEKAFKKRYAGDDATDSGGLIIQFNEANETPAVISPLAPNDLDKRFLQLNDHVQQEIFVGHGVTSPMLFGVRVEGQLGGRSELADAYEIYYNDEIKPYQEDDDRFIEELLVYMGEPGVVETTKAQPINQDWVGLFEKGLVSKPLAQENLGLEVEEVISEPQKPALFSEQNPFNWNDENDFATFQMFGELEADYEYLQFNFAELNEKEIKVLSVINSNGKASIEEISQVTKIDSKEVIEILKQLDSSNKIKWGAKATKITDLGRGAIDKIGGLDKIVMRYKYAVSPEAKPLKGQSRPFCQKLESLGRIYSREDIDSMSASLGYDVWKRRGGWYRVPDSDPPLNLPHCRHEWKQILVRKKS